MLFLPSSFWTNPFSSSSVKARQSSSSTQRWLLKFSKSTEMWFSSASAGMLNSYLFPTKCDRHLERELALLFLCPICVIRNPESQFYGYFQRWFQDIDLQNRIESKMKQMLPLSQNKGVFHHHRSLVDGSFDFLNWMVIYEDVIRSSDFFFDFPILPFISNYFKRPN